MVGPSLQEQSLFLSLDRGPRDLKGLGRGVLCGIFIFSYMITLTSYKKLTKVKVFFKSLSHLQFLIGIYKNIF